MSTIGNWRGPNIVKDGLVLYLDPGSPNSYYNKTSTTIKDISGNGNNGTLTNFGSQTIYDPANGGSIVFDGTNDHILLPYTGNTNNNYTFNIVMKCSNMDSNSNNRQTLFGLSYNNNFALQQFTLEIWGNSGVGFRGNGGTIEYVDFFYYLWSTGGDANSINFYTVTLNSTGHSIYVNGVLKNTINQPYTSDFNSVYLGYRREGNYWNGNFYLFQMYNRVLSSNEILQNFNATKTRFGL